MELKINNIKHHLLLVFKVGYSQRTLTLLFLRRLERNKVLT